MAKSLKNITIKYLLNNWENFYVIANKYLTK